MRTIHQLQLIGLLSLSAPALASGPPSGGIFLPWLAIFCYLICAVIWLIKPNQLRLLHRALLAISFLPLFFIAAFFIPIALTFNERYLDATFLIVSIAFALAIIALLRKNLSKQKNHTE